jgi:hypothetical protein
MTTPDDEAYDAYCKKHDAALLKLKADTPDLPPLPEPMYDARGPRPYGQSYSATQMRDYAAAAVLAERERCAKIAEQVTIQGQHTLVSQMCAAAIRAEPRGQT